MLAIESGAPVTVATCLERGLNPFAFNNLKMTAMDFAEKFANANGLGPNIQELVENTRAQWRTHLDEITIR